MNANLLWRVAIHIMSFYMFIPKSPTSHYQFGKIANLTLIHHQFKVWLTAMAYNWQESDKSKQLEQSLRRSCYCGNLVFLCIKGSLTFCTLCQVWCMNVDVTLSDQTTFLCSWYCWEWHAIFRICLSLDSYFIIFMSRRRMLMRYWEQTRNLKSLVLFQQRRVDHVEQNDVIIACI